MKRKKKPSEVRILQPDGVNYTFIENTIKTSAKKETYAKKKENQFVRNTLKDAKTMKIHYKPNSRSPKSQQNHSPVYE